jgi:hypothetical protein
MVTLSDVYPHLIDRDGDKQRYNKLLDVFFKLTIIKIKDKIL